MAFDDAFDGIDTKYKVMLFLLFVLYVSAAPAISVVYLFNLFDIGVIEHRTQVFKETKDVGIVLGDIIFVIMFYAMTFAMFIGFKSIRYKIAISLALLSANITCILIYAVQYSILGITHNGTVSHDPLDTLYFSIVTWTTLGYGDFQPGKDGQLLAASEALLGYIFMALLIGLVLHLLTPSSPCVGNQSNDKNSG